MTTTGDRTKPVIDIISAQEAYFWLEDTREKIQEGWSCPKCHSEENASIDVFVLSDGTVVELVICAKCGYNDHNAMEHAHVKLEEG